MTIAEAAKKLNVSPQLLRVWAQSEKGCPFCYVVRQKAKNGGRNTYLVNEKMLTDWMEGKT